MTEPAGLSVATVTRLPIERVHPDPLQPRKNADSDLSESILRNGQQVPITVWSHSDGQFTILNGERRYRACIAAKITDIDVMIVPEPSKAERCLKQVIANQGKPLTPIEEAFAFKQIMEDNKWSQNELAKQLGVARSTIGDRIRMIELHPAWLKLIEEGKLQIAHAPMIHKYKDIVPPEAHEKAVEKALSDKSYRIGVPIRDGEVVQVNGQFASDLFAAYSHWIRPLADVPGYEGATIKGVERYSYRAEDSKTVYAADRKKWVPILNKLKKEAKAKGEASPSQRGNKSQSVVDLEKFCKERKLSLSTVKERAKADDEFVVWKDGRYSGDIDPMFFLDHVDNTKLRPVVLTGGYSLDAVLVTTDDECVKLSQVSLADKKAAQVNLEGVRIKSEVDELMPDWILMGTAACRILETARYRELDNWNKGKARALAGFMGVDWDSFFTVTEKQKPLPWKCGICNWQEGQSRWTRDGNVMVKPSEKDERVCNVCIAEEDFDAEDIREHPKFEVEQEFTIAESGNMDAIEAFASALLMVQYDEIKIPEDSTIYDRAIHGEWRLPLSKKLQDAARKQLEQEAQEGDEEDYDDEYEDDDEAYVDVLEPDEEEVEA